MEAGESEGILTPYLDRFGRDMIEGALAYRRIKLARGRLVCVADGTDSSREGDELVFNFRMAIAEDYLNRAPSNFQNAVERAAKNGVYLAARPPFAYQRNEHKRLVVNELEAPLVVELFERKSSGESIGSLARWLSEASGRKVSKVWDSSDPC